LGNLVFIFSDPKQRKGEHRFKEGVTRVHGGWPMINLVNTDHRNRTTSRWATRFLKAVHLDLFLFIDYRRDYLVAHKAMPHVPVSPRHTTISDANAHIARNVATTCSRLHLLSRADSAALHRSFSGHVIHALRSKSRASRWNCTLHTLHPCIAHIWRAHR
jgi:hypothetical protein